MKIAFAALILFVAAPAQAAILDIQQVTSPNGIKAWLVEDHTVPVISLRFIFKNAGAVNDPADKQGVSQILSNTLDEGAGDMDSKAFQGALNDHSISLGFQSTRDDFGGSVKTLSKYQGEAFDLLNLAITKPRFDKDPVRRMIDSNLVRIRSNMTDPEWMNARITNSVVYDGHPYAMNTGGTLSSLPRIRANDLRNKFQTQFAQDNLRVTVAGDMTAGEVATMLDKVFGQLPKTSNVKKVDDVVLSDQPSISLYEQNIPQTVINMVIPGIKHTDPDYHAAEVMDFVLGSSGFGSRLTEEVREKRGLTYGIYSGLGEMEHSATLSIGTATRNEMTSDVIGITKDVMAGMTKAKITEKELTDAKSYLIGSVALQLTSTDRISAILMGLLSENLPPDYMEQRTAALQKLTADDVLRVSKRLLSAQNMKIILVGHPKINDTYKAIPSLPNVE
jgi:zinc protease